MQESAKCERFSTLDNGRARVSEDRQVTDSNNAATCGSPNPNGSGRKTNLKKNHKRIKKYFAPIKSR